MWAEKVCFFCIGRKNFFPREGIETGCRGTSISNHRNADEDVNIFQPFQYKRELGNRGGRAGNVEITKQGFPTEKK